MSPYFCTWGCPLVLFVYTVRLRVWKRQLETYLLNDSAARGSKARDLDILTSGSQYCLCTTGQMGLLLVFCRPISVFVPWENRMQAGRSNYLDCRVLIFLLPNVFSLAQSYSQPSDEQNCWQHHYRLEHLLNSMLRSSVLCLWLHWRSDSLRTDADSRSFPSTPSLFRLLLLSSYTSVPTIDRGVLFVLNICFKLLLSLYIPQVPGVLFSHPLTCNLWHLCFYLICWKWL